MATPGALPPSLDATSARRATSAAVAEGYSFASHWEQSAPLTDDQLSLIAMVAQAAAERPLPPHLIGTAAVATTPTPAAPSPAAAKEKDVDTLTQRSELSFDDNVALFNSHQFYKWHSDLEAAMKLEMEEKYRHYMASLTSHLDTCDHILSQVDATLGLLDDLSLLHRAVSSKTQSLADACERLVKEKERLVEFADALRSKLNYFEELDKMVGKFHAPAGPNALTVNSAHFMPLLKRLDECITYVSSNPQYADSNTYLVKFRQLQSRALGMVRSHVLSVLRAAAMQVMAAMKESAAANHAGGRGGVGTVGSGSSHLTISEGAETSLLYVRFKAAAGELKSMMEEMESRVARREYAQLIADCHQLYCDQRLALVQGVVVQRVTGYAKRETLPSLTRSGCAYLIQVCQLEHQLFDHFFPATSAESASLAPLIDPLCMVLYDVLRPRFIHEADVDVLCELVDIVRAEVLEEQLQVQRHSSGGGGSGGGGSMHLAMHGGGGDTVAGLRATMVRILADLQQRLTFRAHTFMRDEISNYIPTPDDLDYPAKLEKIAAASAAAAAAAASDGNPLEDDETRDAYAGWYPPLESTLACLSKLYRCVDANIFTGLAQEAVAVCSDSIQRAGKVISRKSSQLDGTLFLIKHLLILREQIAPFDVEFAVTVKELDFSHTLDHLRRVLRGQASFLSLTSGSSFLRFSPRVTESHVDSKKELEKTLKTTCEQFIMSVTKLTVEPFLSFITKVTAVRRVTEGSSAASSSAHRASAQAAATPALPVPAPPPALDTGSSGGGDSSSSTAADAESASAAPTATAAGASASGPSSTGNSSSSNSSSGGGGGKQLRDHAFAVPQKVGEVVSQVNESLKTKLPEVVAKMRLYLHHPSTRAILFKPIKSNIAEAYGQIRTLVELEYSEEDRQLIGLLPASDLQSHLDSLA